MISDVPAIGCQHQVDPADRAIIIKPDIVAKEERMSLAGRVPSGRVWCRALRGCAAATSRQASGRSFAIFWRRDGSLSGLHVDHHPFDVRATYFCNKDFAEQWFDVMS
jgi:hypothetical protein